MWFGIKQPSVPQPPILHDGTPLTVVDKQKYLGVTFDSRLAWSSHISKICGSMSYYLMLINSHVKYLPSTIVKMLIESLVFSQYTYALHVWGPTISKDSMSLLQRMQNRAVHMTCGLRKYDHVSQDRANLGWLPMSEFVKYRTILTMFGQHYLGEGILLQPPIDFGRKHSYRTIDVHLGLQTFFDSKKTLVSASFGIRLQCGRIHCHLIYLMTLLIFMMVCSSTYMTCLELFVLL